ncbi:replication protein A 32 kDa subunit-B [Chrysoperla carnea]|uniref:replication protein A 32 kDa subunit-B n=1 Tax=Chrysoperla carnea TaxID=189513 RepID=UPI001D07E803|nr:replication protein A 32 kDa subunit-B [Chrysoperla carnea]
MWLDDYDNAGGQGGGGFDANTTVQGGTKQTNRSRQLMPMFIKHMHLLSEDLTFFGQTIQMVELYGVLRSQTVSSTKVIYELEDFSDKIICHLWLDHDPDQAPTIPNLMLNAYCRVVGTLKSLAEGRRVMILKIENMNHPNELVTFMLSAICARYEIEKMFKEEANGGTMNITTGAGGVAGTNNDLDDANNMIGTPFQYKVYKAIGKCNGEPHGGTIKQIQDIVKCTKAELMDTLEFLTNEGHVYTTIDDDHYKVAA